MRTVLRPAIVNVVASHERDDGIAAEEGYCALRWAIVSQRLEELRGRHHTLESSFDGFVGSAAVLFVHQRKPKRPPGAPLLLRQPMLRRWQEEEEEADKEEARQAPPRSWSHDERAERRGPDLRYGCTVYY